MTTRHEIYERLRERVIREIHLNHLAAGDRLPGVRQIAREEAAHPRTVAAAYRKLENEGLVEMRARSGVYLAAQGRPDDGVAEEELARWMEGVLVEAWERRIRLPNVPDLFRRFTRPARLRCALVESVTDAMEAYAAELRDEFGLDVVRVRVPAPASGSPRKRTVKRLDRSSLAGADLIATTSFHAAEVGALAEAENKPLVLLTTHPDRERIIRLLLRAGELTLVCAEPDFGGRMRELFMDAHPERFRVVLATDTRALAALDPDEPVLLTRAARAQIGEVRFSHLPHSPTLSPETARQLAAVMLGAGFAS